MASRHTDRAKQKYRQTEKWKCRQRGRQRSKRQTAKTTTNIHAKGTRQKITTTTTTIDRLTDRYKTEETTTATATTNRQAERQTDRETNRLTSTRQKNTINKIKTTINKQADRHKQTNRHINVCLQVASVLLQDYEKLQCVSITLLIVMFAVP